MDMHERIAKFTEQFTYEPHREGGAFAIRSGLIVAGMGGSALPGAFLKMWKPEMDVIVHRSYGLPPMAEADYSRYAVIVVSYSGNTEEALDVFRVAQAKGLPVAVVASGGMLLEEVKKSGGPYVVVPVGIEPRVGTGYMLKAILALIHADDGLQEMKALSVLSTEESEALAKQLAESLMGYVSLIYASKENGSLAYAWKVIMNETAKTPSFANVLPEFNHNEMTSFVGEGESAELAKKFAFIFLKDARDDMRIAKRITVTEELLRARGLHTVSIEISGVTIFEKIFRSLILAHLTAYYLASAYGSDPSAVPIVEEFKKLIK